MEPKTDYDDENYDKFFNFNDVCDAIKNIVISGCVAALLVTAWFKWVC